MMIELVVHEAVIAVLILVLIFVILIVIVLPVTNSLWGCVRNRFCGDDR
jgi:uncharacterized membrane protein YdfJ with MMPL/SSD domain